jgi:hypothetical protein
MTATNPEYIVQVRTQASPEVWQDMAVSHISMVKSLDWNKPPTASMELDNEAGANRITCDLSRKVRVIREGSTVYVGVINEPDAEINDNGSSLKLTTRDYYRDILKKKGTGPAHLWTWKNVDPRDLIRAAIGTRFLVQEWFESPLVKLDIPGSSNISVTDKTLALVKNGASYQPTGYLLSNLLRNSEWNTMGTINSLTAILNGTTSLANPNTLPNPGFESGLTGFTLSTPQNLDFNHTDTLDADFNAGTLSQVVASANALILQITGSNLTHTDTLTADFDGGTKTNVSSASDKVELTYLGVTFTHQDTFTGDFDAGTKTNVSSASDKLELTFTGGSYSRQYTTSADFNTGSFTNTNDTAVADQVQLSYTTFTGGYSYRSSIPVNGSADGTRTYQLKLTVNKGVGTNAAGVLYLQNLAQSWASTVPNDLRFYASDDTTALTYWIESSDANTATIWIKVPSIPSGGTNIFAHWGKASDTTTSSTAVWDFYDGFDGGSLGGGWTNDTTYGTCTATVSGSILSLTGPSGNWGGIYSNSYSMPINKRIICVARLNNDGAYKNFGQGGPYPNCGTYGTFLGTNGSGSYLCGCRLNAGSLGAYYFSPASYPYNQYHRFEICRNGSTSTIFKCDGTTVVTDTTYVNTTTAPVRVSAYDPYTINIDWIAVGEFTPNEPSFGTPAAYTRIYTTTGTWQSPSSSISGVGIAQSSSISWNATLNGGTVAIQTSLDGGSTWQDCTNGNPIPNITPGYNCAGKSLLIKATLTAGSPYTATPLLLDVTAQINSSRQASGSWVSPADSISGVGTAQSSSITWTGNVPANTTMTVEVSLDGGSTWQAATSGSAIPGITAGYNCAGKSIKTRVSMTCTDSVSTPSLYDISLTITPARQPSGSWESPALALSAVGIASSSSITWNGNVPANTTMIIQTSLNGGSTWQTCTTSGQAIPNITPGYNCSGKSLLVKVSMTCTDSVATPTLNDISVSVNTGYPTSGSWESPAMDISTVLVASGSTISWNTTPVADTTVAIQTSLDGGSTWQDCVSGSAIPGITDGTNLAGKSILVKATLGTTNPAATPQLLDCTINIPSQHTQVMALDTSIKEAGAQSLWMKAMVSGPSFDWHTNLQAGTPGNTMIASIDTLGTGTITLSIYAYNSGSIQIGVQNQVLNINDAAWTGHSIQYTLPASTAYTCMAVAATGPLDVHFDQLVFYPDPMEVQLQVSRDAGSTWVACPITWNGSSWQGSVNFTGAEAVKNQLKYKVLMNATTGNTKSPVISSILLNCVTDSDTGITEGTLEAFNSQVNPDDTLSQSFGDMKRDDVISKVVKVTGQEGYINADGQIFMLNHRGSTLAKTWTVGKELKSLRRKPSRDTIINKLTLIGSGQINENSTLVGRSSQKDDASIAQYGPIEGTLNEKDLKDQGVINNRCHVLLQKYKQPQETVEGPLVDGSTDWDMGDAVTVVDASLSTGQNGQLRIVQETRSVSKAGEIVQLVFSNVLDNLEQGFNALVSSITNFTNNEQPSQLPTPISLTDNIDKDHPGELLCYIDPKKATQVEDILISVYSRKFRTTVAVTAAESAHTHTIGNHSHSVSWGDHSHGISHTHGMVHTHGIPDHHHYVNMSTHNHVSYISNHTHHINWVMGPGDTNTDGGHSTVSSVGSGSTRTIDDGQVKGYTTGGAETTGASSSSSSGGGGGGSTSSSSGGGQTSSAGSSHVHVLEPGIYEYDKFAPCTLKLNTNPTPVAVFGTQGSETEAFSCTLLSIKHHYAADGSLDLKPGMNWVYVCSAAIGANTKGLLRIIADIRVVYKSG